ncbi:MAG: hypothetical protein H7Z42_19860, partial [Roseiflexaceae bacterium]|nr:hypothetical protein [Roseiflexaceae bacterium]
MNHASRMARQIVRLLLVAVCLAHIPPASAQAARTSTPALNLSHVCENGVSEVHFVLLNVADDQTPGNVTYRFSDGVGTTVERIVAPERQTGNVWHYRDYPPNPMPYDVTTATVAVGGTTIELHNPHDYNTQICGAQPTAEPTSTPTDVPTVTNTPVPPTATSVPTELPTNTPVPPTATSVPTELPTNTPVPPTATSVPTSVPTN